MKLLVFEYITGGGLSGKPLPQSLRAEGEMMVKALLADLRRIATIELLVLVDHRCQTLTEAMPIQSCMVPENSDVAIQFKKLLDWADAVWLIAPEFDGILERYTRWVERANKRLLNSNADAVAMTANKWRTFELLQSAGISTIPTDYLSRVDAYRSDAWVIKPVDGVGCHATWLVENAQDYAETIAQIKNPDNFLIQPYLSGITASLSALFYRGQSWLLCVNKQHLTIENRQFALQACSVNALPVDSTHQSLVTEIAKAIPGLFGYVGIDLIITDTGIVVVEINPRLTTSYVGIYEALGINCAELIVLLDRQAPNLQSTGNRCVKVEIA